MGRHRGLPLHSGTLPRRGCPGTSRLRNRVGAAHIIRRATAGTIRMGRHRGLPLNSGTRPRRGCPGTSRLHNRVGAAHIIRRATAGAIRMGRHRGLPLHSGTRPRRGCPGTSRLRNRVGAAHIIRRATAGPDFRNAGNSLIYLCYALRKEVSARWPSWIAHALRRDAVSGKPHPKIQPAKLHPQSGYRRFTPARGG